MSVTNVCKFLDQRCAAAEATGYWSHVFDFASAQVQMAALPVCVRPNSPPLWHADCPLDTRRFRSAGYQ